MLDYYFRLALVSLRRHWTLTLLIVVAIALGVANFGIDRIHASELLICALVVVSLGQFAAMFPALRAASTSPTEALRAA
jgi:hypothetical protein